jgi:hypothetical protein
MKEVNAESIIRVLASGGFICQATSPEACRELSSDSELNAIKTDVENGLDYLGMQLKASSEVNPDYFYASPVTRRLEQRADISELKKELNLIIKNATGYLGFVDLLDKATGSETIPNTGHTFDLGEVQSAMANRENIALHESFSKLISNQYFKPALKNRFKNDKERLDAIIQKLAQDGLIEGDGTGINYEFTGRFEHYITIVERIKSSISPNVEEDDSFMQQQELIN